MNRIKERFLSLLSREVRRAYRARDIANDSVDYALQKNKDTKKMLDRALREVDILTEVAEHWRSEATAKQKLFSDIVKEVEGAEDLHNLRQIVREMAFRNESYGAIICRPNEDPKVIVTDERVI